MITHEEDIEENTIEHRYTENIVCPYCGDKNIIDSLECLRIDCFYDTFEATCTECGNDYIVNVNIEITYTTNKKNTIL